ncbi:hypothetical protein RF11_12932 [Thelohanellus kitauei]|uniref:Uncharacterized protein n=1 Tax=Thelohanellus kitauei TaxID=669202 RepID=A0A0C2IVH5_THEKT|nr:hypothetical protein RF11_12932 [Thelohanellus kitauei]
MVWPITFEGYGMDTFCDHSCIKVSTITQKNLYDRGFGFKHIDFHLSHWPFHSLQIIFFVYKAFNKLSSSKLLNVFGFQAEDLLLELFISNPIRTLANCSTIHLIYRVVIDYLPKITYSAFVLKYRRIVILSEKVCGL